MKGKRKYPDKDDNLFLATGEYGKTSNDIWMMRAPKGHIGNLDNHNIVEHDDGTITVSPSILIQDKEYHNIWHGYLEKGIWREC